MEQIVDMAGATGRSTLEIWQLLPRLRNNYLADSGDLVVDVASSTTV